MNLNASRNSGHFEEEGVIEIREVAIRAADAVRASLRDRGFAYSMLTGCNQSGLFVRIAVAPADLRAALAWREGFGRSYGPVRVFVAEAK